VGTVAYALAIGPLAQLFLPIFATNRRDHPSVPAGTGIRA
jgi:hypothetical protein